jgi:hypothetical protein
MLPCKNCISYAICRSKYNEIIRSNRALEHPAREHLQNNCSILNEYITRMPVTSGLRVRLNWFHKYMRKEIT